MARKIFGVITTAGLLLIIGTVGASDCNTIGFWQIIVQSVIGSGLLLLGGIGLNYTVGGEYYGECYGE